MQFDLKEINSFFDNYQKETMPDSVRKLVLSGSEFSLGDLMTCYLEFKSLKMWAPDIAKQIKNCGTDIPAMRIVPTPVYHIYHPITGVYLGNFDIKVASKEIDNLFEKVDLSDDDYQRLNKLLK